MSEEKLTITTWLTRQFFDIHKDNGWLVAEMDRRLPGPLCSIATISPANLSYITRTQEPLDEIETKFKEMSSWLDNVPEETAMKTTSSGLSYALRAPEVPGRVLTAILLCGPTESAQARFEAIQKVLEAVRQEAEQRAKKTAQREEDAEKVAHEEMDGVIEEEDFDAEHDSE